jgi:arylsulfatase A-like enzyme
MQLAAPQVVDFSNEPAQVLDLYGIGEKETDDFGRQLLLARRLAERGVRFIQICHAGGGNGAWDAHGDIKSQGPLCRATDKPIAGLIRDLKQRGMLDETLVVWSSEFGRSPWSQNTTGRDHNPRGYTVWLAGGGVKGGIAHGATDDVGYKAVENRHYYSDLHATILHQLGLDYKKMEVSVIGRTMRLVEESDGPIKDILS